LNKREQAVLLGATGNMAFAVGNVLIGIKKHSPELEVDFIILHENLSESDKQVLNKIYPCKFIDYHFPEPKQIENSLFYRYTKLAFSRYEMFNLLDEYKKIAWIDIDILIQDNIQKLFDACIGDMAWKREDLKMQCLFNKKLPNIKNDEYYFNSGIIVATDKIPNYKILTEWLYNKTFEYAESLLIADQAILNYMIHEFPEITVTELDEKYNYHPMDKNAKNAVILHSYSTEKFWNYYNVREWNENYKKWLKMGGSKYTGMTGELLNKLLKKHYKNIPNPIKYTKAFLRFLDTHFSLMHRYPLLYFKGVINFWAT